MYKIRHAENGQQWFVELQEGTKWKICYIAYTEARANEFIKVNTIIDKIMKGWL